MAFCLIRAMFLGRIVVSHVQSIAKLSQMSASLRFQLFFPIQTYPLFDRECGLELLAAFYA